MDMKDTQTAERLGSTQPGSAPPSPRRSRLILRALGAFLLLAAILVGLYWWGYHSYPTVATWGAPGHHETFVYEGNVYERVGKIGTASLTLTTYPLDQIVGKVEDDGLPMFVETEAPDPDLEDEETRPPKPPNGDPTLAFEHAYVLYGVKKKENFLLLLEADGEYYVYRKVVEEETQA